MDQVPEDDTLLLPEAPADMATRLDRAAHWALPCAIFCRIWSSRWVRLALLVVTTFAASFFVSHFTARAPRVPELPRAATNLVRVPVALVEPAKPASAIAPASAVALLAAGNVVEAETAYRELAAFHPDCPVFAVVARVLRSKNAARSRALP